MGSGRRRDSAYTQNEGRNRRNRMKENGSNQEISPAERGGRTCPETRTLYRSRAPAGSVGNPLRTTLSCLLWAISNVCDRIFCRDKLLDDTVLFGRSWEDSGFPFSKRPCSDELLHKFPICVRSSVALLCASITMGAMRFPLRPTEVKPSSF
ncbi:hypothetical protein TNCV_3879861 [Trichonephila clavipes]|nr:hypothetical protein TNCV_3879861 [Trichonephila clavipes]